LIAVSADLVYLASWRSVESYTRMKDWQHTCCIIRGYKLSDKNTLFADLTSAAPSSLGRDRGLLEEATASPSRNDDFTKSLDSNQRLWRSCSELRCKGWWWEAAEKGDSHCKASKKSIGVKEEKHRFVCARRSN
jgi:hypothetical protein